MSRESSPLLACAADRPSDVAAILACDFGDAAVNAVVVPFKKGHNVLSLEHRKLSALIKGQR